MGVVERLLPFYFMERKKERRLYLLAGQIPRPFLFYKKDYDEFSIKSLLENASDFSHYGYGNSLQDYRELLNLLIETKWSDQECYKFWFNQNLERQRGRKEYRRKPIPVRKDNPNTYGEKFSGGGTRRRPRKKAKTAWKRFFKLFPNEKKK